MAVANARLQHRAWLALCALLVVTACRSTEEPPAEPEEPAAAPEVSSPATQQTPEPVQTAEPLLRRAVGRTFGLPVPEGLSLVERTEDVAHFETSHSLDQLVEFYRRTLEGYAAEERAEGMKFSSANGEPGTDVYVVLRGDMRDVFYFSAAVELPEIRAEAEPGSEREVDPESLPFAERYFWRQGPVAPPALADILVIPPTPAPIDSSYYEERFEEIDGERVRVLTVRSEPSIPDRRDAEANAALPPTTSYPPAWHRLEQRPGGSYDRGDGQRSLRPTPGRGRNGEVLPFWGTETVPLDQEQHMH